MRSDDKETYNMTMNILIVEDEIKLAELLYDYLIQANMSAVIEGDGARVMPLLEQQRANNIRPDIILLDIMLPNKDGITLCREIRDNPYFKNIPIIMTTARVDEIDRILGLDMGADDYICKPYSPREVIARVKAIARRLCNTEGVAAMGLLLDNDKVKALLHNQDLLLTAVEYSLLALMAASPGKIFSRTQLMDNMYHDYRVVSERTIDSHIKKLRQKIHAVDPQSEFVKSVYGVGYKVDISE